MIRAEIEQFIGVRDILCGCRPGGRPRAWIFKEKTFSSKHIEFKMSCKVVPNYTKNIGVIVLFFVIYFLGEVNNFPLGPSNCLIRP